MPTLMDPREIDRIMAANAAQPSGSLYEGLPPDVAAKLRNQAFENARAARAPQFPQRYGADQVVDPAIIPVAKQLIADRMAAQKKFSEPMVAGNDPALASRMGDVLQAEASRQGDVTRRNAASPMSPTAPPLWAQSQGAKAQYYANKAKPEAGWNASPRVRVPDAPSNKPVSDAIKAHWGGENQPGDDAGEATPTTLGGMMQIGARAPMMPDASAPTTREGAQALIAQQRRLDPNYQNAIAAKRLNNTLPFAQQASLPVRLVGPTAEVGTAPGSAQADAIAVLNRAPLGPNAVGQARLDDAARRQNQYAAIQKQKADAAKIAAGPPAWAKKDGGDDDVNKMIAKGQLELANKKFDFESKQADASRGDTKRTEAMKVLAGTLADVRDAQNKLDSATLADPLGTSPATAAARNALALAKGTHSQMMSWLGPDMGLPAASSAVASHFGQTDKLPVPGVTMPEDGARPAPTVQFGGGGTLPPGSTGAGVAMAQLTPAQKLQLTWDRIDKAAPGKHSIEDFANALGIDFIHQNPALFQEFVSSPDKYGAGALQKAQDAAIGWRGYQHAWDPRTYLAGMQAPQHWALPDNQRRHPVWTGLGKLLGKDW